MDKLELKLVPDENVKIGIAMNEKIAAIAFPDLKDKMHTPRRGEAEILEIFRKIEPYLTHLDYSTLEAHVADVISQLEQKDSRIDQLDELEALVFILI